MPRHGPSGNPHNLPRRPRRAAPAPAPARPVIQYTVPCDLISFNVLFTTQSSSILKTIPISYKFTLYQMFAPKFQTLFNQPSVRSKLEFYKAPLFDP